MTCILTATVSISLLFLTNPNAIGPTGVTFWFILVLAALTSFLMILSLLRSARRGAQSDNASLVRAFRTSVVPAGALVILLGMSSLGTLGVTDVALIVGASAIIELYLYTNDRRAV